MSLKIILQPWKHLLKTISWLMGQIAWVWAKTGVMESDYAEAYGYVRDEESATRSHEDYENEEKEFQPIDPRDEKYVGQYVVINRTRPEVCDKEVRKDRL